jgi:uncharacterized surface protein with fasciclin (FAS1) repeats
MINLKYTTYLFVIFFLFISCENNARKSDVKKSPSKNTELKKQFIPIDNGENLLFQRLMFNQETKLFAGSLTSSGLADIFLKADNQFTVFAPSNDAFKAVNGKILSDLFKDRFLIAAVMKLHIIAEKFDYDNLLKKIASNGGTYSLKTLMGEKIKTTLVGNQIVLTDFNGNQARVIGNKSTSTDDGVYYVIDKVMAVD